MLLFIVIQEMEESTVETFQYISCCYLSYAYIVYPNVPLEFQYISCCYLSNIAYGKTQMITVFQYISCCYLSHQSRKRD